MKKSFTKILVLSVLLILSLGTQAQIKKAALISVFGSRNLSDDPLETKLYEAIMKDSSFNLSKVVTRFDSLIINSFLPQFPFPFLTKPEVVDAKGYKDLLQHTKYAKEGWRFTAAKGYIPIAAFGSFDDETAIKKAFEILPTDVEGVMIAYVDFNIYDEVGFAGMSSKKIYAYVNIKIFDRNAKRIFKLKERASSDEGVFAAMGVVTDTKKIMPMIESASKNLFSDMKDKLPKSLAKMAKKMAK